VLLFDSFPDLGLVHPRDLVLPEHGTQQGLPFAPGGLYRLRVVLAGKVSAGLVV
jgi:hypothetical protein